VKKYRIDSHKHLWGELGLLDVSLLGVLYKEGSGDAHSELFLPEQEWELHRIGSAPECYTITAKFGYWYDSVPTYIVPLEGPAWVLRAIHQWAATARSMVRYPTREGWAVQFPIETVENALQGWLALLPDTPRNRLIRRCAETSFNAGVETCR